MKMKLISVILAAFAGISSAACADYKNPFDKKDVVVKTIRANGGQVWFQFAGQDCLTAFLIVDQKWGAEMMRFTNSMLLWSMQAQAKIAFQSESVISSDVPNSVYAVRVMNITLGTEQFAGTGTTIDYMAKPVGAEVTPGVAKKIVAIRSNGEQTWIQFEGQNSKVATHFVIDNYWGTEMFKTTNALALYAFQTGTPVRFYQGPIKAGGNTPRVMNLTLGGV